jgi:hypothetical protein
MKVRLRCATPIFCDIRHSARMPFSTPSFCIFDQESLLNILIFGVDEGNRRSEHNMLRSRQGISSNQSRPALKACVSGIKVMKYAF